MFVGRDKEIKQLSHLLTLKKASIVVCRGRRRIGKSTLIQQFGKNTETQNRGPAQQPKQRILFLQPILSDKFEHNHQYRYANCARYNLDFQHRYRPPVWFFSCKAAPFADR